jgi:uncharacterized protein
MDPTEAIGLAVAGFAIGTYASAIGAGGGFLFAPLLLILYPGAPPAAVTTASLTVVVASAFSSILVVLKDRLIDFPLVLALASLGIPVAILGGLSTAILPREYFAIGFAVLLGVIGGYLVAQPVARVSAPSRRAWSRERVDRTGQRYLYRVPLLQGLPPYLSGVYLGALAGIGGGPVAMPVLTRILRVPHPIAASSVQVVMVLQSGAAVLMHLAIGNQGEPMEAVPWLIIGAVAAAPAGRLLRQRLGEGPLTRALAFGLFFIAARTAWAAF